MFIIHSLLLPWCLIDELFTVLVPTTLARRAPVKLSHVVDELFMLPQ